MTAVPREATGRAEAPGSAAGAARPALLPVADARARIVGAMPLLGAEQVGLAAALRRIVAEDVIARLAHPPAAVSAMDGYALRAADIENSPATLKVIGTARAGLAFRQPIAPGTCVRIFTGATVPDGADAIALQEDAVVRGEAIELSAAPAPGRHIRAGGIDFAVGERCVPRGRVLSARDIGLIAACGHGEVSVRRKPRIAILATGDELVAPGTRPGPDCIVGSNSVALAAAVAGWGGEPVDLGIAPDRSEAIGEAADAARGADLLITSGGASVGDHDLVQAALATRGFRPDFWKIAMRPGKPLMFGRLGDLPVIGTPGNPVSALICALLFVQPAIAAMLGLPAPGPLLDRATLATPMPPNDLREDYVRTRLTHDARGLVAEPFPRQDSALLLPLAQADGLVRRHPFAPAAAAGEEVEVVVFDRLPGCF